MDNWTSFNWEAIEKDLEHAPDEFLRAASRLWRSKQEKKRLQRAVKSGFANTVESTRQDAEQQVRWKAAYDSATEKLIFSGEFKDKGERIRLLKFAKLVKRTEKQIHIVVPYTLYHTNIKSKGVPVAWSTSPTGGVFSDLYNGWLPVTRYRMRRVAKSCLYSPEVLNIPGRGETLEDRSAHLRAWKRLCGISLFANESEYACWHIARFEDEVDCADRRRTNTSHISIKKPEPYRTLGLPGDASQTEIKAAYKRLAMKCHPDRGGTTADFQKIMLAYEKLRSNRCG
jgi:DnaJ family protein A protein 2